MPSISHVAVFLAAAAVILVVPGPVVAYVVARSAQQGRRAGLISVAGTTTGLLVHVGASVAGLSALLLSSATAFRAIKLIGGGYLIYLGIRTLLKGRDPVRASRRSSKRLFIDGLIIQTFNPKPALFFAAFLPQFVDRSKGSMQLLTLGLLFCALALVSDGLYAILAGTFHAKNRGQKELGRYAIAATYLGLGAFAIFSGDRR